MKISKSGEKMDKIAVYTFVYMGQFLKIGQANSKVKQDIKVITTI